MQQHAQSGSASLRKPARLRFSAFGSSARQSKQNTIVRAQAAPVTATRRAAKEKILAICSKKSRGAAEQAALDAALQQLIAEPSPGGGTATLQLGDGTWEVISAPHISRMSQAMGTEFSPIRYVLKGDSIISNVRYSSSLIKEGWLSASGSIVASDPDTVKVVFDKFWVDGENSLRPTLPDGEADLRPGDAAILWLGRRFFFDQLSYFPVLYVDDEIAVFSFPPLRSNIAVQRVS